MGKSKKLKATGIEYHRNGIAGEGFHVVKFNDPENGKMLAVVFPLGEGQKWNGRVAVFNLDLLGKGTIQFGVNSWRGDQYEGFLRYAIENDK